MQQFLSDVADVGLAERERLPQAEKVCEPACKKDINKNPWSTFIRLVTRRNLT
jgi:hypothetical protein